MPIVSISLTTNLLSRLDELVKKQGYSSRSEAIRNALRTFLSDFELSELEKGRISATITVISRHERHDVDERLMRLRHEYDELVTGNMHIHVGGSYCLEIFITEGESQDVLNFIGRVCAIHGVDQVKYTVVHLKE